MTSQDRFILVAGSVLFVAELAAVLLHPPFRPALGGLLSGTALSAISYAGTILVLSTPDTAQHPVRAVLIMLAKGLIVAGAALAALTWAKVHLIGFLVGFSNFVLFARLVASLVGPNAPGNRS